MLDGGKLTGSEFHHTVVLICRHEPAGAFGLVLNRPTEQTVAEALTENLPEVAQELPLFLGGPVQPHALSYLIHEPVDGELTTAHVLPGLRLAHNLDELLRPAVTFTPDMQLKFFAGYAGWSAGQLDNELKDKAWLTYPATIELVFHATPAQLWRIILRTKGPQYRLLAETPDDISRN